MTGAILWRTVRWHVTAGWSRAGWYATSVLQAAGQEDVGIQVKFKTKKEAGAYVAVKNAELVASGDYRKGL